MTKKSTELDYVSYKIIQKYKDPDTKLVDGIKFNKIISLLNQSLLEEDIDIKLPHFWYLYGDMVIINQMPKEVIMKKGCNDSIYPIYWRGDSPKPDKRNKKRIDRKFMALTQKYPPNSDIKILIDAVYEYAPFDFQRDFLLFRNDAEFISPEEFDKVHKSILFKGLKKSMANFPYEQFPRLKVAFVKIESILPVIFSDFPELKELGNAFGNNFWRIFCKLLRLNKDANYNVTSENIEKWEKNIDNDIEKYIKNLDTNIRFFFEENNPIALNDPLVRAFLLPDDWGKGTENLSSEIDNTVYN